MRLDRLLNDVDVFDRPIDASRIDITSIAERVEDVVPGSLFCCVVGAAHDGHDNADDAVKRGAIALLAERELSSDVPVVRVPDARSSIAPLAAAFYGHPARRMRTVGVTGTNGKTTATHLLDGVFRHHGWKSSVIGTLSGFYTTPPALQLQHTLASLQEQRTEAVALEVSSSGLVQHRVDAIKFDVAVFTNLTQDHLDYHGTMQSYFEAKSLLFEPGRADIAVVNVDDPWGRRLVERLAMPVIEYSLSDAERLTTSKTGSAFEWGSARIHLPLVGEFNVMNALAAANAAKALHVPVETIAEALSRAQPVPGRLELVQRGQPFAVIVDFAHTPDGLENVLRTVRSLAATDGGKTIVVFGCGGDRDADKRPQMGAIAHKLADRVIVTTDNARSEAPAVIARQVVEGMPQGNQAIVELDRRSAIEMAIDEARPGDVVVIAGKGHERTQEIAGHKTAFDDRAVAAHAIDTTSGKRP